MPLYSSSSSSMEGIGSEAPDHETGMAAAAAAATNDGSTSSSNVVAKGKRTKRQRLQRSLNGTAAITTASSSDEVSGSTTEEDEDVANCLILLAQGRALCTLEQTSKVKGEDRGSWGLEKSSRGRFAEAATTSNGKAWFYVYKCKTCNKCFPSFQALGGHRASHKKPKTEATTIIIPVEEKKASVDEDDLGEIGTAPFSKSTITPDVNNNNNNGGNKMRVHECLICGSEFPSGQALGGHMRRHRSITTTSSESPREQIKKEKNLPSLDLNLPAPTDDDRVDYPNSSTEAAVLSFASKQSKLLFSTSAMVDCHY